MCSTVGAVYRPELETSAGRLTDETVNEMVEFAMDRYVALGCLLAFV